VGFARKANKITIGRKATIEGIRKGKVHLVILAKDAGNGIKREIENLSDKTNVRVLSFASKRDMGEVVGRESCSILGLMDARMAQGVIEFEQNKGL